MRQHKLVQSLSKLNLFRIEQLQGFIMSDQTEKMWKPVLTLEYFFCKKYFGGTIRTE